MGLTRHGGSGKAPLAKALNLYMKLCGVIGLGIGWSIRDV